MAWSTWRIQDYSNRNSTTHTRTRNRWSCRQSREPQQCNVLDALVEPDQVGPGSSVSSVGLEELGEEDGRESEWYRTGCNGSQHMCLFRMCVANGLCCAVGLCLCLGFLCAFTSLHPSRRRQHNHALEEVWWLNLCSPVQTCVCVDMFTTRLCAITPPHLSHDEVPHNTCPNKLKIASLENPVRQQLEVWRQRLTTRQNQFSELFRAHSSLRAASRLRRGFPLRPSWWCVLVAHRTTLLECEAENNGDVQVCVSASKLKQRIFHSMQ